MKKHVFLGIVVLAIFFVFTLIGCSDDNDSPSGGLPGTPTSIVATAQSSSSIIISWPMVSGALQYYVYKSEIADGTYTQIGVTVPTDTGVCSFTATGLSPGTAYYFRVSSYNAGGESPQSQYVTATTNIAAPTDVTATVVSSSSIKISWTAVSGATGYYVYRSESANGTYTKLTTSSISTEENGRSYTVTGLSSATTYYFKVSAYDSAGETSQSSYTYATTLLPTPTGITAIAGAGRSITISWSEVNGSTAYRVYYSTSADGVYTIIATPSTTQYAASGLFAANTIYYFKISAYNSSAGESELSSSVFAVAFN